MKEGEDGEKHSFISFADCTRTHSQKKRGNEGERGGGKGGGGEEKNKERKKKKSKYKKNLPCWFYSKVYNFVAKKYINYH